MKKIVEIDKKIIRINRRGRETKNWQIENQKGKEKQKDGYREGSSISIRGRCKKGVVLWSEDIKVEEGGKRKEGIKHAELAERVPSDAYHHGYLDKCIKTTPSTPSQYRTDCAPQTRYTSISRTSFAIQRIPAVFEYIHIYIYSFDASLEWWRRYTRHVSRG